MAKRCVAVLATPLPHYRPCPVSNVPALATYSLALVGEGSARHRAGTDSLRARPMKATAAP